MRGTKKTFGCFALTGLFVLIYLIFAIFYHVNTVDFILHLLGFLPPQKKNQCMDNIFLLSRGVNNYHVKYGSLPQYGELADNSDRPLHSWRVLILPYIGYKDLYDEYDIEEHWDGPNNKKLHDRMPDAFRCPLDRNNKTNCSSYMAVIPPEGILTTGRKELFIIETNNRIHNWLEPVDMEISDLTFFQEKNTEKTKTDLKRIRRQSRHYKKNGVSNIYGTNVYFHGCMCISEDTKPEALKALADPEKRDRVKITYPWGEDFGIVRAVLIDEDQVEQKMK